MLLVSGPLSAKELANGWTKESYQKHYMGCIKGAIGASLKKMVDDGTITKETSRDDRKAHINKLYMQFAPLCKCVQNSIVDKVQYKNIDEKTKDKNFKSAITKSCIEKHMTK